MALVHSLKHFLILEAALIPFTLFYILIHVRLFGVNAVVAVAITLISALIISSVILWYGFTRSAWGGRHPFWLWCYVIGTYVIASHVCGVIGAVYSGLRVVTGTHYLFICGGIMSAVNEGGFRPAKTW